MPRPYKAKDIQSISKSAILSEMVDKHREVILDYLPSIPVLESPDKLSKPIYRNFVIFGSLMLCPLLDYLKSANHCPWISITLVEDDLKQLLATLSLIDLETLVNLCKSKSISLILHIDELTSNLQDRVYHQLSNINPTLLYGWQTLRSPVKSPALMEVHSWLHAPEGVAQNMLGVLGFATDEINQTQQALWNALSQDGMRVLSPDVLDEATPVVLVASGPSLNSHIEWLKDNQNNFNIVAAGSALGVLLRAGIRPSVAVFLERGWKYFLICALCWSMDFAWSKSLFLFLVRLILSPNYLKDQYFFIDLSLLLLSFSFRPSCQRSLWTSCR